MNTLNKLVGKAAMAAAAIGFGATVLVYADTGSPSCSDSSGSVSCSSSQIPCCISGTDANGNPQSVHTCCMPNKECKIKYSDGTVSAGGLVDANRTVTEAGCI